MAIRRTLIGIGTILLICALLVPPVTRTHSDIIIRGWQGSNREISLLIEDEHNFTPDDVQLLQNFGTVTTVAGPIAVLHSSVSKLPEIARLPFVVRIENSHSLSVSMDKGVLDSGAPQVWNEVKDPYGRNVTGAGVIIGFVDTGIDTTHPDFNFPNGSTKILYVWDQTTPGRAPIGFNYGYECNSADIQAENCPEKDTFGHGTHVAGIAASSGMARGNYPGVAPGARIIFVKSGYSVCNGDSWTFFTSQILDGVSYIVKKAAQLHMPAVISLSLGGNIGAHDGTDPLELGLDAIVQAGTPVVVAAGNQARDNDHIRGQLTQGGNVTLQLELQSTTIDLQVDVWYSPEDQIDATLTTPDGKQYPVPTPPGGMTSNFGNVTTITGSTSIGRELYLEVNSTATLPTAGWSVNLKGTRISSQGLWNAWTDALTCSFPGSFFIPGEGYVIDANDTVGTPGTAKDVVTVGAYISQATWKGMNGQIYGRTDIEPGGIASFSSLGPTRDGRIKPDVVAPGALITSARSSAIPSQTSDPDPFHRILAGTSMSTPHVAGTVALIRQYEPDVNATEIPGILRETARPDARTGALPNGSPVWGFGKVDARSATGLFRATLTTGGVPSYIIIPFFADNDNRTMSSTSWVDLYFTKGTTHSFSFQSQLQAGPGARYELENDKFAVTTNTLRVLNYSVQYFLTVNSRFGPTSGQGWYNANTTARFSAPDRVPAPGLLGYFGVVYTIAYWTTDNGKVVSDSIRLEAPRTVTAVYQLSFTIEALAALIIILIAILAVVVIIVRKRMK